MDVDLCESFTIGNLSCLTCHGIERNLENLGHAVC